MIEPAASSPVLLNHLRLWRLRRDLTQTELAALVSVSKNTISSIETGLFCPSARLAARLCLALDCKFEQLFYFE